MTFHDCGLRHDEDRTSCVEAARAVLTDPSVPGRVAAAARVLLAALDEDPDADAPERVTFSAAVAAPEPVVLRSHYADDGSVERIEVLEAPELSLIAAEQLEEMDPKYRDGDELVFAPDVRYRVGAEHGDHGERLLHRVVAFSTATDEQIRVGFALDEETSQFAANKATRVISGLAVPWGEAAYSGGALWMFDRGSLHWSADSRVKLDRDHQAGTEFGKATALVSNDRGLHATFSVANTTVGDTALELASSGVYDGLSVDVSFDGPNDGWGQHPDDPSIRLVHSATLRKIALTAMPAFDDARVAAVAARRAEKPLSAETTEPPVSPEAERGVPVTAPSPAAGLALAAAPLDNPGPAPQVQAPAAAPQQPAPALDAATFTAGINESIRATVEAAFANLPQPQRQVIPAGQAAQVTREAPVYLMNGHGPSLVRDSWKARTEHDHEAGGRLRKFAEQTRDQSIRAMSPEFSAEFAVNTGNASQIIPPGYRPDLYVTQLLKGRPLTSGVSRGTISDATPFNIPSFVSASGATAAHVEGTNPTGGSLTLGTVTVAPGAISGVFELSREIVDSANPAVDAIAMNAMHESYSQQTEAAVYAELNGTNGVAGTITSGLVPSGAQASTTTGGTGVAASGDELIAGIRAALALYPFRRFGAPDRAYLSQEATSALAGAIDTTGRPLLPSVGSVNSVGTGNTVSQGWFIDGLTFVPAWSMTGNTSGDADVIILNSGDVWAWESPLLMFRFEERGGPARIDLALFGYFATRILRPVGLAGIRHTVT